MRRIADPLDIAPHPLPNPAMTRVRAALPPSHKPLVSAERLAALRAPIIASTIFALVVIVFSGALRCGFMSLDDTDYATRNPHVQEGLSANGFAWAFTTGVGGNYIPITWVSLMIDGQLSWPSAFGFHLTNVLLHAASAAILFLAINRMTGDLWRSAAVAALFAVHPLRVESVAWISERKDVLGGFFGMLALLVYARYARSPKPMAYWLVIALFALSLLSKPMLVTLPALLLLLDFWPLGRIDPGLSTVGQFWRLVLEKLPMLAISVADGIVTIFTQRNVRAMDAIHRSPVQRLANAVVSYGRYLQKTVWFGNLAVPYPYPEHWPAIEVCGSLALLAAVSAAVICFRRSRPWLAVGWFWFVGMLAPAIGITQVGWQSMADRFSYFPSIGLFVMLVWSAPTPTTRARAGWLTGAAVAGVATLGIFTVTQIGYWRDNVTLFRHVIAVTDDNWTAEWCLAGALSDSGNREESLPHFRRAIDLNPTVSKIRVDYGSTLQALGRVSDAEAAYRDAIRIMPTNPEAHSDLGALLLSEGDNARAVAELNAALAIDPNWPEANVNLGLEEEANGRLQSAENHLARALPYLPEVFQERYHYAIVLSKMGHFDEAFGQYEAAIRIRPLAPEAHSNFGVALRKGGHLDEAIAEFNRAIAVDPNYAPARRHLQEALAAQEGQSITPGAGQNYP